MEAERVTFLKASSSVADGEFSELMCTKCLFVSSPERDKLWTNVTGVSLVCPF